MISYRMCLHFLREKEMKDFCVYGDLLKVCALWRFRAVRKICF